MLHPPLADSSIDDLWNLTQDSCCSLHENYPIMEPDPVLQPPESSTLSLFQEQFNLLPSTEAKLSEIVRIEKQFQNCANFPTRDPSKWHLFIRKPAVLDGFLSLFYSIFSDACYCVHKRRRRRQRRFSGPISSQDSADLSAEATKVMTHYLALLSSLNESGQKEIQAEMSRLKAEISKLKRPS